ncbi:MAG: RNA polymerase sigma factor [Parasphingorhabdus sp.]
MNNLAQDYEKMSDLAVARCAARLNHRAIALITTRNNQRLFRTAWSVLRNHADAEDVVQEAYLKAFRSIENYSGTAALSTWLTRIVLNAAIDRKRSIESRRVALENQDVAYLEHYRMTYSSFDNSANSPNSELARSELSKYLKAAVSRLPDQYRTVFILRDIEGMSISETADAMEIPPATVKSRLFRARRLLRKDIESEFGNVFDGTITFAGADCKAMTTRIVSELCPTKNGEEK